MRVAVPGKNGAVEGVMLLLGGLLQSFDAAIEEQAEPGMTGSGRMATTNSISSRAQSGTTAEESGQ